MLIILKKLYPYMDYRRQAAELAERLQQTEEDIIVDCSDLCLSRSAMDQFYKDILMESSPLAGRVTLINTNDDFDKKLKAVKKTYNFKKQRIKIPKKDIITISSPDDMKRFVESLRPVRN